MLPTGCSRWTSGGGGDGGGGSNIEGRCGMFVGPILSDWFCVAKLSVCVYASTDLERVSSPKE